MAPGLIDQAKRSFDLSSFRSGSTEGQRISTRLALSYILDWVFIIGTAAIGAGFHYVDPNRHAFVLGDPSISFPKVEQSVSVAELIVASIIVPAAVILLVSLFFIPGRTADSHGPKGLAWRRKLWECNVGWMGLGVAYAATFAATEGLKASYGKPRPDLLARCNPDLQNISAHTVGPLSDIPGTTARLVSWTICQNTSARVLRSGFTSFPSGHASMSFAGLTYLSLWLCSKFSIAFPSMWRGTNPPDARQTAFLSGAEPGTTATNDPISGPDELRRDTPTPLRNQDAAPPTYLLLIALLPVAGAFYIASSRWSDNRHFGWDILAGSLIGAVFAFAGFRLYQLPLSSGAGWAWGPRSRDRAFFAGVGLTGYVGKEGTSTARQVLPHQESGNDRVMERTNTSGSVFGSRSSRPGSGTGTDQGEWGRGAVTS